MARLILSIDDQVLAEYNMTKERYSVGRLADNDIRIDNPTVSGHHSLIINILNDSFLEDLGSTNGTYVNGRLVKKHALQNGDVITIGRHQLRFVDSADEEHEDDFSSTMVIDRSQVAGSAALEQVRQRAGNGADGGSLREPRQPARIQVLNGSFAGREISLEKALTTLGRPGVQVVAVTRRSDGYHVIRVENAPDRGPPKLNDEPLGPQAVKLNDNDVIELVGVKMGFFSS